MRGIWLAVLALGIGACSDSGSDPAATTEVSSVAEPSAPAPNAGSDSPASVAVAVPRIAYIYKLGFRLSGERVASAQAAHVALCDRLGTGRCQLLEMSRNTGEAQYAGATTKLRVASGIARSFADQLEKSVAAAGGRAVDSAIEAEDVSKAMVDTEARIRQRALLVERLTAILRTRDGKVADLVEAERSVAQAQEELDQARGWLAELRGRVAYSTFELSYSASAAGTDGVFARLGDTIAESGNLFVIAIDWFLRIAIFLLPWVLLAGVIWWLWRRRRRARAADE